MRNHITPPKLQYILQYTDANAILQNADVTDDFSSWNAFETDIVRDDLTGAYIQIQSGGIVFTGEAYDIVRGIYEETGIRSIAKLFVNLRKDTFPNLWTYEQKVSLDLNFADYDRTNTEITLTANENGLKEMVKANGSQKYDIPVTNLSPEILDYDGLDIKETLTWFTGDYTGQPNIKTLIGPIGSKISVPFIPSLVAESQDVNASYSNYITQDSQGISKFDTSWKQWDGTRWNNGNVPCFMSGGGKCNITINATLRAIFGYGAYDYLTIDKLSLYLVKDTNQPMDVTGQLKLCEIDSVGDSIFTKTINSIVSVDNLDAGNYYIVGVADVILLNAFQTFYISMFQFDSGGFIQIDWISALRYHVPIPVVSELNILQQLINNITNTVGVYDAQIDAHKETIRIACGESIRNFLIQYIHTSFSDFAAYMKSCWGYEYEINGTNIHFAHQDSFFVNTPTLIIPEITNYKITVNKEKIYTGVKIGIALVQYLSINGTDEFRFLEEWSTGVQNVVNVLDLTCPYRTDAYGFQLLSEKQHVSNTTDDQSDNSIFVLHVSLSGSNYVLNRDATITGVFSTSMFNAIFSPRQCLVRNSSLLGVSCDTLKFTSTVGHADVTINGISEKADILIPNSLFSADVLDMEVGDIVDLPVLQNGLVSCQYRGEQFHGFIKKLSHFWGENQKTTCTLFLQKRIPIHESEWSGFVCEIAPSVNHLTLNNDNGTITITSTSPVSSEIQIIVRYEVIRDSTDINYTLTIEKGDVLSQDFFIDEPYYWVEILSISPETDDYTTFTF